jgi:hypothetical protein
VSVAPPSRPTTGPVRTPAPTRAVTASELILRTKSVGKIAASELERWLLEQRLAEPDGAPGLLRPTARGRQLGGALTFLG